MNQLWRCETEAHLTITQPEVARALTKLQTARLLEPFMKRERTLSEAAGELGVKLPALLYHVERFIACRLLEVVREVPRKGRALKVYRSTAEQFFVPFQLTPSETLERLLNELTAHETGRFQREIARTLQHISPTWGLHIALGDNGVAFSLTPDERGETTPYLDVILGPNAPAIISIQGTVHLDFQTAKALQGELHELYKRYSQHQADGQLYAYQFGLTPLTDDTLD